MGTDFVISFRGVAIVAKELKIIGKAALHNLVVINPSTILSFLLPAIVIYVVDSKKTRIRFSTAAATVPIVG